MSETNDELILRKCKDIAELIPDAQLIDATTRGWHGVHVTLKDGLPFYISHYHGRIEVSGDYPRYGRNQQIYTPGENAPHITAGITRPATAIAKDIDRRFLPYYRPLWFDLKRKADEATAEENAAYELVAELINGKPFHDARPAEGSNYGHPSYKARSSSGKEVDLTLNDLTPDIARAVIKLVREMTPEPEPHVYTNHYCDICRSRDCQGSEPKPEPKIINPCEDCGNEIDLGTNPPTGFIPLICKECYEAKAKTRTIVDNILNGKEMRVNLCQNIYNDWKWSWSTPLEYPQTMHGTFDKKFDAAQDAVKTLGDKLS